VCVSPEATYNELLRVNAECSKKGGVGHTDEQMATKFGHLLQTHHPTAYIGLLTDLARAGSDATIQMLWHSAQITCNALARNATLNPVSNQIGQQAPAPRSALMNSLYKTELGRSCISCSCLALRKRYLNHDIKLVGSVDKR
jgi:hypothetical protein